ncbi:MAG TPA: type II CAAX endopeptidase family protein [Candidatus Limnocylindrales bacterium]|nr:type II CAAX endopeptidase family protein [Candidatus Limnocylindrales bacterium]
MPDVPAARDDGRVDQPEDPAAPEDGRSAEPGVGVTADGTGPVLGLFRFTIEGRRAPGLFVAGWLATLLGAAAALVGLFAGEGYAGSSLWVLGLALVFVGLVLLGGTQALEKRAAGVPYAGPSPILVFAATIAGLYLSVVIVGTPLRLLGVALDGPSLSLLGVALQALVVVIVLRVLVVGTGALGWGEMGLRAGLPGILRDLAWGALFAMPVIVVTALAVAALVTVVGSSPESPLPPAGSPAGLAINLLAGAVIAPLYEELLFRGFATTAWARVIAPMAAVLRTSVLFAVAHILTLGGDDFGEAAGVALVAAVGRLPVALALGWVFIRRRSLWASVGLHAAFNGILLVLAEVAVGNLPTE